MNKMINHPLKLAVGIHGTIVFLENYPHEEEFQGLHEMVEDLERDVTMNEEPGIYEAILEMSDNMNSSHRPDWDYNSYLDIKEMKPIMIFAKIKG